MIDQFSDLSKLHVKQFIKLATLYKIAQVNY